MQFPGDKVYCHRTGFMKKCGALVKSEKCNRWSFLEWYNPNTDTSERVYDCVDNLIPKLQLELGNQMRQMGAAIESFRNAQMKAEVEQTAISGEQVKLIAELNERFEAIQRSRREIEEGGSNAPKLIKGR